MKYGVATLILAATLSAQAAPTESTAAMTYNIALQNEFGLEKQTVTVPMGGEVRELTMAGGVVQIRSPGPTDGRSLVKFFANKDARRVLLHTVNVAASSQKPLAPLASWQRGGTRKSRTVRH